MTEPRDDSSCLDAETIAAWLDGGLPDAERAAAEAHAATCEHCRALAATIVRNQAAAAPDAFPVPAGEPHRRSRWPWLAPLAVAAILALAIWIPRRGALPAPESTVAMAPLPAAVPPPAAELSAALEPQPQPRPAQPEPQIERPALAKPPAPSAAPSAATTAAGQPQAPPQPAPSAAPPPPPPPAPVYTEPTGRTLGQAVTIGQMTGAGRGTNGVVVAEFESPAPVPVQAFRGAGAGGGGRGGGGGAAGRGAAGGGRGGGAGALAGGFAQENAAAASFSTPLPDPSGPTRWRVLATGVFERSSPAGAPWERMETAPPDLRIVAGVAPSSLICWMVGREGVVLLSLDAQVFRRLPFPEAIDLVSVRATSARMASVRTSDGRTLTTMDGGQTWLRD